MGGQKTAPEIPAWLIAMRHSWGGVPSSELLVNGNPEWKKLHLGELPEEEAIALGLIGRYLKYGQSLGVALPLHGGDAATRLMYYLHRMRFDALRGGMRAPWMNPSSMHVRSDVIFICKPRSRMQEFYRVPHLRSQVLRKDKPTTDNQDIQWATVLANGSLDIMELVSQIESKTLPFALVVDATVGGIRGTEYLDRSLMECFPDVPRIIMMTRGDSETIQKFREGNTTSHLWMMRYGDLNHLLAKPTGGHPLVLHHIADEVANATLQSLWLKLLELIREQKKSPDPVLKEKLTILKKVFNSIAELSAPLNKLEVKLEHNTRPGRYPVRTMARWIQLAEKESCKYGESEMKVKALLIELKQFHATLLKSITGKAAWVMERAQHAQHHKTSLLVLCGSQNEASALEDWLDEELEPNWGSRIHIVAMDGSKSARLTLPKVSEAIITGTLWPNRQHWLTTSSQSIAVMGYPFELKSIERNLTAWWAHHGQESIPNGDKLSLWTLALRPRPYHDEAGEFKNFDLPVQTCNPITKYPAVKTMTKLNFPAVEEDWFEALLALPEEPTPLPEDSAGIHRDFALIYVEENEAVVPWAINRPVLVLSDKEIEPTLPGDLKQGDAIIILKHTEERVATQERLFELVAEESEGMQQFIKAADRWQVLVNAVAANYKSKQVQPYLKAEGVDVKDPTIQLWFRHKVYGPLDNKAILVFAQLAKVKAPDRSAVIIANGIQKVRTMHRQIGMQLGKAILEISKGKSKVTIGALTIDTASFQEMFEIATVRKVSIPDLDDTTSVPQSLNDVVEMTNAQFPGRLIFTTQAMKSIHASPYKELDKFSTCLQLMATVLHDHYQKKNDSRLHEVLEIFTKELIEFCPSMSDVTMGKFNYQRKYKNRNADLNRHFKLGNAWDTTKTLRIHFEWDEDDQAIVIHHAGEHLQTNQN